MEEVKILFSKDDVEMMEDLEKEFGPDLKSSEESDFIGDTIVTYVIPSVALGVQILNFIFTHLVKDDDSKGGKKDPKAKRKVEIDGQRVSLTGYSADEIRKILFSLGLGV